MIHCIVIATDVLGNWERRDRLKSFLIVTPGWMELNSIQVCSQPRCLKLLFLLDHSQCSKLQPVQWNLPPHRRGEHSELSNPRRSQWLLQCSWESVQGRDNQGRANTGTTMPNLYCPRLSSAHRTTRWTWSHLHSAGCFKRHLILCLSLAWSPAIPAHHHDFTFQEFVVFSPLSHQIIVGSLTVSGALTSQEITCTLEDKGINSLIRIFRLVSGLRGSKVLLFVTWESWEVLETERNGKAPELKTQTDLNESTPHKPFWCKKTNILLFYLLLSL